MGTTLMLNDAENTSLRLDSPLSCSSAVEWPETSTMYSCDCVIQEVDFSAAGTLLRIDVSDR